MFYRVSLVVRFIPVYTGNTRSTLKYWFNLSVYPCVYREHLRGALLTLKGHGLSLCIQGTPRDVGLMYFNLRFIPVYTGNTLAR